MMKQSLWQEARAVLWKFCPELIIMGLQVLQPFQQEPQLTKSDGNLMFSFRRWLEFPCAVLNESAAGPYEQ